MTNINKKYDVVIIGGGQSGLALGYYLRRSHLQFIILDKESSPGGSWQHYWLSLRLFSPAQWSSLPGMIMPGGSDYYPTREETVQYLSQYENKYELPVKRSIEVTSVTQNDNTFYLATNDGVYESKVVISATGSFCHPYIPPYPGIEKFKGKILHSAFYQSPEQFLGKRVAIVGEGNSGAQILAEVSTIAKTLWITQKEPRFLADHIDGRFLFDAASQMYKAKQEGKDYQPPSLGDIVMVKSVQEARTRGVLATSHRTFTSITQDALVWDQGHEEKVDAIIFCTGFRPSLNHLMPLNIVTGDGKVETEETKVKGLQGLWLVGYGNWTGFASATLIGVGRSAKRTVEEIITYLAASLPDTRKY